MKYIIEWSEKKVTSTGKQKIDATLKDEGGNTQDKVTIWSDFPNFLNLMTGSTVEGDVVVKQNGQYTNKTLYPAKNVSTFRAKPNFIAKAQETKQEHITASQDKKEMAIILAGSARDATLISLAFKDPNMDVEAFQESWKYWRAWLYRNHGDSEDLPSNLKN